MKKNGYPDKPENNDPFRIGNERLFKRILKIIGQDLLNGAVLLFCIHLKSSNSALVIDFYLKFNNMKLTVDSIVNNVFMLTNMIIGGIQHKARQDYFNMMVRHLPLCS